MPDPEPEPLSPQQKAARAASFGGMAAHYERYRPGPPPESVDWIVPTRAPTVVDLGAGTGALSRLLVERADEVVAVEPDDRMRAVLAESVPGVRALAGRGESIPLPDASVDAVIASSSWHWMDPVLTEREVGRVLVPGGTLAALWSGPDPESPFMVQATAILNEQDESTLTQAVNDPVTALNHLEILPGAPFDQPEEKVFFWEMALDADDLIGLLGTLSWVILMEDEARAALLETARRLLRDVLGVEGDVTVDVGFRSEAWKARRHD